MSDALSIFRTNPLAFQKSVFVPSSVGIQQFGAIMAPFQEERFRQINPSLISVAKGEMPERNRFWWEATKGASKDSDLAVCVLWLLAFSPIRLRGQVGAADKDQANELLDAADGVLRATPWLGNIIEIKRHVIANGATGAECRIVAADDKGAHGSRPDFIVINELSHIGKRAFAETMFDNASKVPKCLVAIGTNAGFQGTWQWKWREAYRKDPRWVFNVWDEPAPWIPERDIQEASKRNTPSRFKRLWWGVWSAGEGDALTAEDVSACMVMSGPHVDPQQRAAYFMGLDLSVNHDHSALVTLAAEPGTRVVEVAGVESWAPDMLTGKVSLRAVREGVNDACKRFRPLAVLYDPTQAALMAEDLIADGVPMVEWPFSTANCTAMARQLLQAFKMKRIRLYHDDQLRADLHKLSIQEKNWGYKLVASSDETGHADRAIALAIALPAAMEAALSEADPDDDAIEMVRA